MGASGLIPPAEMPRNILDVIRRVRDQRLTYLPDDRLRTLAWLSLVNESENREGIVVETGCGLGGSAIVLCAAKRRDRPLHIYDRFGMIPAPGGKDGPDAHGRYEVIRSGRSEGIGGDRYYGYLPDLHDRVSSAFAAFDLDCERSSVTVVPGLLQDTLRIEHPVALAHVDVDWYEPVLVSLERIYPKLVLGGALVIDDYRDWSGCRKAVDDFFADKRSRFDFDNSFGPMVARLVE